MVAVHNGEEVKDLPYLPQLTASSSNLNPKPAEDKPRSRSRSQGRPPKTNPEIPAESGASGGTGIKTQKVVREDTGGENTKKKGDAQVVKPQQDQEQGAQKLKHQLKQKQKRPR